jgi:hypothetical protein
MNRNWKYSILAGGAAVALSLTAFGSVAEPERGHMGRDGAAGAKVYTDRGNGDGDGRSRGEVTVEKGGDRDWAPSAKVKVDRDDGAARSRRGAGADAYVDKGGDRNRGWKRSEGHDRIVRRGHRYLWGPGVTFYLSDGYYYGECGWLKRRAIQTGDRIWWRRYERCRDFS